MLRMQYDHPLFEIQSCFEFFAFWVACGWHAGGKWVANPLKSAFLNAETLDFSGFPEFSFHKKKLLKNLSQ